MQREFARKATESRHRPVRRMPEMGVAQDYQLMENASWAASVTTERDRLQAERKALRREYGALYENISKLLFAWDPKGINFGDNTDEYEPEVGTIVPRLRTCASAEDVQRVVYEEFQRWFGVDEAGVLETYERIGRDIWALVRDTRWVGPTAS